MGIAMVIQILLAVLPILLKWLVSNKKADTMGIRSRRIERILGMCGKCRAASSQAGFVPDDNVSDDGTAADPDTGGS